MQGVLFEFRFDFSQWISRCFLRLFEEWKTCRKALLSFFSELRATLRGDAAAGRFVRVVPPSAVFLKRAGTDERRFSSVPARCDFTVRPFATRPRSVGRPWGLQSPRKAVRERLGRPPRRSFQ